MELIVSRWKIRRDEANCRPVASSQLAQDREDVDYLADARYTRDVKNGGGGGDDGHEAERFILASREREVKLRGQFSCAVMLAKFAQLKRVEAEEGECGGM